MGDNQLSGTDFGKFPTGILTSPAVSPAQSELSLFNCFSLIAIDAISHGSYGLRGLFFSTIKLCATQFIVELKNNFLVSIVSTLEDFQCKLSKKKKKKKKKKKNYFFFKIFNNFYKKIKLFFFY